MGLGHRLRDQSVVSSVHCMNDPQAEGHMASHIGRRKFLATLGVARAGGNTCGPQSVHVGSLVGNRTLSRHRRMTESETDIGPDWATSAAMHGHYLLSLNRC